MFCSPVLPPLCRLKSEASLNVGSAKTVIPSHNTNSDQHKCNFCRFWQQYQGNKNNYYRLAGSAKAFIKTVTVTVQQATLKPPLLLRQTLIWCYRYFATAGMNTPIMVTLGVRGKRARSPYFRRRVRRQLVGAAPDRPQVTVL